VPALEPRAGTRVSIAREQYRKQRLATSIRATHGARGALHGFPFIVSPFSHNPLGRVSTRR